MIVSVPMYFLRKFKRGYNHSEIISMQISQETGIKYSKNALKRIKHTRQQSTISKQKRLTNLQDCFKLDNKYLDIIDKKTLIIVDDVVSTWTTINELAKILKQNWAKKVIGLVVASN